MVFVLFCFLTVRYMLSQCLSMYTLFLCISWSSNTPTHPRRQCQITLHPGKNRITAVGPVCEFGLHSRMWHLNRFAKHNRLGRCRHSCYSWVFLLFHCNTYTWKYCYYFWIFFLQMDGYAQTMEWKNYMETILVPFLLSKHITHFRCLFSITESNFHRSQ